MLCPMTNDRDDQAYRGESERFERWFGALPGWLLPLGLVLAVGLVRHVDGRARAALLALATAWGAGYLALTIRLLLAAR